MGISRWRHKFEGPGATDAQSMKDMQGQARAYFCSRCGIVVFCKGWPYHHEGFWQTESCDASVVRRAVEHVHES